ncbi:hypothetical protein PENTCL1PPCAC_25550, partial [Pristionchus entomophagus]
LFSVLPSTLSISRGQKPSGLLDIHMNVDVASISFDFTNEWLTMETVVTLAWTDASNPYLPKHQEEITHYEGETDWLLEIQFMEMWMPPIKQSMEEDEYRKSRTKMSEATFRKNGSVEIRFFYSALV